MSPTSPASRRMQRGQFDGVGTSSIGGGGGGGGSTALPPSSPVGLYGSDRPAMLVGPHELSRSNPMR